MVTFNLKDTLNDLIQNMEPPAKFKFIIPEELPKLHTEKIAIEQVFANYISNAIIYNNNAEPEIEISVTENHMICTNFVWQIMVRELKKNFLRKFSLFSKPYKHEIRLRAEG